MPTVPLPKPYPRFRIKGEYTAATEFRVIDRNAAGTITNNQPGGYTSPTGEQWTMTDMVVPRFGERLSLGEVIFNPMEQNRFSVSSTSRGAKVRYVVPGTSYGVTNETQGDRLMVLVAGRCDPLRKEPQVILEELELPGKDRAIAEAVTKAGRIPTEANLLVTMAEFRQTMRLVPDLLKNWASLYSQLNRVATATGRKGQPSLISSTAANARSINNALTDTWLAMRFGVRPLIMDTLGVLKVLKKQYDDTQAIRLTSRGSSSYATSLSESSTVVAGVTVNPLTFTLESKYMVRAMQLWELEFDALMDAGLHARNIPEAAIDLVRFSFVLNWVVNVNDFFAALGSLADPSTKSLGACYVLEEQHNKVWQSLGMTTNTTSWAVDVPQSGVVSISRTRKTRVIGQRSPKLVVRGDWSKFLTDLRLVDAVALLSQQTRGRGVGMLRGINNL